MDRALAGSERGSPRPSLIGLGAAFALFALTTPFFFIDWHAVSRSLEAETVGTVTNDRSGWIENLGYYAGEAIPNAISWVAPVLAVAGIAIAAVRRDTRRLLLVGFGVVFLGVISLSSLHWERWAIQVLPLVVLFGVSAVVTFAALRRSIGAIGELRRWVLVGVVVAGTVAIAAEPAVSLVDAERMPGPALDARSSCGRGSSTTCRWARRSPPR